jgi:hypothetical protein
MPKKTETSVLLHPTRMLRLRLSMAHAVPGLVLVLTGITGLREEGLHPLPIAEVAAGAAVLIAVARELRRHGDGGHGAVGWVEIFAGLMLMVEGWHAHHPGAGFQPGTIYGIAGLLAIGVGIAYPRIPRIRKLVLDDERFHIRTSPFRRLGMPWRDVETFETGPREIAVRTREGKRHSIDLGLVENRAEVVRLFAEWAKREIQPPKPPGPPKAPAKDSAPPQSRTAPIPSESDAKSPRSGESDRNRKSIPSRSSKPGSRS